MITAPLILGLSLSGAAELCTQSSSPGSQVRARYVHVQDWYLLLATLPFSLDSSHSGATPYCPAVENMTIGLTHPLLSVPIFRFTLSRSLTFVRGHASSLSHQS